VRTALVGDGKTSGKLIALLASGEFFRTFSVAYLEGTLTRSIERMAEAPD